MKKLFLLSVMALGAITMNAQITFEGTVNYHFTTNLYEEMNAYYNVGKIVFCASDSVVMIYNEDMTLDKKVVLPKHISSSTSPERKNPDATMEGSEGSISYVCRNIFSTDNKIAFIRQNNSSNGYIAVYNEDGEMLLDIPMKYADFGIIKVNNKYKLIVETDNGYPTFESTCYIYSLPGNGEPTDLESPISPTRTSNVRKVVENGQMYIILDGVKYAVTGSQAE